MSDNKDLTTPWWEAQRKVTEFWQQAFKQFEPANMTEMFSKQMELFYGQGKNPGNDFMQFYTQWLNQSGTAFREMAKWMPEGAARQTMEKMLQAGETWAKLYSFWSENMVAMPGKNEFGKWQEFSAQMMQNYDQVLDSLFAVSLPEPVKTVMKSPAELCEIYHDTCQNIIEPWVKVTPQLQEKMAGVFQGDRNAYAELQELWLKTLEEAWGKVLKMPMFGQNREAVEKALRGLDTYIRMVSATNRFSSNLYKVGYDAMEKIMKNMTAAAGTEPTSFHDFYTLWWQTNEEAYNELFKSESFSEILGETVDAFVSFKRQSDDLIAEAIRNNLPLPTNKEVDSLSKSVQQLKRNVRDHNRQLKEINEKLDVLLSKGGVTE